MGGSIGSVFACLVCIKDTSTVKYHLSDDLGPTVYRLHRRLAQNCMAFNPSRVATVFTID